MTQEQKEILILDKVKHLFDGNLSAGYYVKFFAKIFPSVMEDCKNCEDYAVMYSRLLDFFGMFASIDANENKK